MVKIAHRCPGHAAAALALALALFPATVRSAPEETTAQAVGEAERNYVFCLGCHRADGSPGGVYHSITVDLRKTTLDHQGLISVITNGRREKGMPAYDGLLNPGEIEALASYIETRIKARP